jgi:hypothetical protein
MENEINNVYIKDVLNELVIYFGVKEPIVGTNIFNEIREGKINDAAKQIAKQLELPIDINIIYIPNEYQNQSIQNEFKSKDLVKHNSNSKSGITAQVLIPSNLPAFGSFALINFPINIKISNNCTTNPLVFTMIMAHELSHVLLYSLNHKEKENEFYTDITAMLFGFQLIFQNGRKYTETKTKKSNSMTRTTTYTTTYGYLSDEQFENSIIRINEILDENRGRKYILSDLVLKTNRLFSKYNKALEKFKYLFSYIAIIHSNKVSKTDSKRISELFQPGYIDELETILIESSEKKKRIKTFLIDFTQFNKQGISIMENYIKELTLLTHNLNDKMTILKTDSKMIDKYVSYNCKINYIFSLVRKKM